MYPSLTKTLLTTLVLAAFPVGAATAQGGGHGHGKGKQKKSKCHKGKGYEVQGTLAEGTALAQSAGAETKRRSDDRFSGTLVVDVTQGNKRGRRDLGLSSYAVESVKLVGQRTDGLPELGARVLLVGKQTAAGCTGGPTDPTDPPVDYPTDPQPTASRATFDEDGERGERPDHPKKDKGEDAPSDDTPSDHEESGNDEPAPTDDPTGSDGDQYPTDEAPAPSVVTDVKIKLVRVAAAR